MKLSALFRTVNPREQHIRELKNLFLNSALFDPDWYLTAYPDVRASGLEPIEHFCRHGDRELRSPSPTFNSAAYAAAFSDLEGMGALEHFMKKGDDFDGLIRKTDPLPVEIDLQKTAPIKKTPDEIISEFFDGNWYLKTYADVRASEIEPLSHFISSGLKEGRDPGPGFSSSLYSMMYAELMDANESAFAHYVKKGHALGLKPPAANQYPAWRELFERIDESDLDLMRDHARRMRFRSITIVHIFDALACENARHIFASWRDLALQNIRALVFFGNDASRQAQAIVRPLIEKHGFAVLGDQAQLSSLSDPVLIVQGAAILAPHSSYLMLEAISHGDIDFVYGDHDCWREGEKQLSPHMKPAYSPTLLRNSFYVGPAVLCSTDALKRNQISAIIKDLQDGSADALANALLHSPRKRVAHVPFVLCSLNEKSSLPRVNVANAASSASKSLPRVSIIILTRDKIDLLRNCLDSIFAKSTYPRELLEFIVVDNDSTTPAAKPYFSELRWGCGIKVIPAPCAFNFAYLNNLAAKQATGEVLILLNNDTVVIAEDWIEKIVEHCIQPDVGAVGCRLLYPDDTIQHAGCVLGVEGLAAHRHVGKSPEDVSATDVTRELTAITGACLGVRKEVYEMVGGLDETLRVAFNDIKFCIDCATVGLRNVYIADSLLYHLESKSRGFDVTLAKKALQLREAIYTRRAASEFFRNDPFYSPNLSQTQIDDLAFPPRRVRPWVLASNDRRKRIMLVSITHAIGSGVAVAVYEQARRLVAKGYDVIVAGPASRRDFDYSECQRIIVDTPLLAAGVAVRQNVDCVIVHTPPFFNVVRYLGPAPFVYFVDYGEPNSDLFPDRVARDAINWEKRFCAPLAKRIFAISETIKNQSLDYDVIVARIGNSHLAQWTEELREKREAARKELGWEGKFVVLNICRFGTAERLYKGVDKYIDVAEELWFRHADTHGKVLFCLAGKGDKQDIEEIEQHGIAVFANISDKMMELLLAAADFYMNFSKWEGYNLGIGQALAMGLPVIASDIEAHREFPVERTNDVAVAVEKLYPWFLKVESKSDIRQAPYIESWDNWAETICSMLETDLSESPAAALARQIGRIPERRVAGES
ncbi:glycosyltransferase [Methylocystis sp. WRRC1]|uniref:glycosyltransferase n=1 Tax=Methylocystis sp. WRRC1 TaxID=1732014 RepID=UPI001D1445DF|nr:glycosyltransferase [Methylocystis sp. WRRC1]MCC3243823.1 glycosyltransferase [Methylocystis sp. WRRC1]